MTLSPKEFCFCTLALGSKYRKLTKQLADDLEKYSPGTLLVVYTDEPRELSNVSNILAYKYRQQGILLCYHDKRAVIEEALTKLQVTIYIDADTRIINYLPEIEYFPGIIGRTENLLEHINKYTPERLKAVENVASKLEISLDKVNYVGESLFLVGKDGGKEKEFVKYWGLIGRYLELHGIHGGDGNAIGLAAAKVGWTVKNDGWKQLQKPTMHLDASYENTPEVWSKRLNRKLAFHYRLNLARLTALKNFNFFYT